MNKTYHNQIQMATVLFKMLYPERFAQEALGHNSKAVHRAYARKAKVMLPPLEDYERKIINLHSPHSAHIPEVASAVVA
jgi:hypothetical protein